MASASTKLFAGSRHQTFQDAHFRTAGNDIYSPTYNIHFNAPGFLTSEFRNSETSPSVPEQAWSRIFQQVSGFFRSADNRGALIHGSNPSEGEVAGPTQVQYSIENPPDREDIETAAVNDVSGEEDKADGQSEDNSNQSPDDCLVSSMSELELKSTGTTSAEIYTRCMLSATSAGLACWHPQPRKPAGERGIIPGDVGTFNLTHGFRKIFNVWEDKTLPEVARSQLPLRECAIYSDEFGEGHTIVSGTSSKTVRAENGRHVEWFEFRCQSEQGAVLACTASADLEELVDSDTLRDFLIQHAGIIYQHATSIRRIPDDDPLYIVSGCIKSNSWALAAYRDPADAPDDLLTLCRRRMDGSNAGQDPIYDWIDRGTAEARFGSNSSEPGAPWKKDQCLFLQGFKLALSRKFRTRLKTMGLSVRDNQPSGSRTNAAGQGASPNHNRPAGQGSSGGNQLGTGTSNSLGSLSSTRDNDVPQSEDFQVDDVPDLSGGPLFHPCDKITGLLLDMTGADCALSHDDDWRKRNPEMFPWNDALCFDIIASKTIIARNGVSCLVSRGDPLLGDTEQQTIALHGVSNSPQHQPMFPSSWWHPSQDTPPMSYSNYSTPSMSTGTPRTPHDMSPYVIPPFSHRDHVRLGDPWSNSPGKTSGWGFSPKVHYAPGTTWDPYGPISTITPAEINASPVGVMAPLAGGSYDAVALTGFGGPPVSLYYRPEDAEIRMDPFMEGEHYGPVLTPMIVHIVGAKLELNPMLLPPRHPGSKGMHLTWNLLCSTSHIHYPGDTYKPWSSGTSAPATFPRTSQLTILTMLDTYPWPITVNAKNAQIGVTCEDVVNAVERSMRTMTNKNDWEVILGTKGLQNEVARSYKRNRGGGVGLSFAVPGSSIGKGMVRMDFLRDFIYWGGLEAINHRATDQNAVVISGVGSPCSYLLKLEKAEA